MMAKFARERVRFGIVGCGVVSQLHAEALKACPITELVAVADVDRERAGRFAVEHGVPRVYTDFRELLAERKVDAVCVCTPSGMHGDIVLAAAEARKHVLCEKPLEIRAERMTAMIEACRRAGVKLGAVYQRRALPLAEQVKRAIDRGELGKLVLCDASLKYYRHQAYYDSAGWRGTWAMDGGGALMNQGVHGVDMIQWLAGGVVSVFGKASALARRIEVEDTAVAVVRYQNGALGVIEAATTVYPERNTRFEIHGERGTIVFDDSGLLEWCVQGSEAAPGTVDTPSISGVGSYGHYRFVEDMAQAIVEDRQPLVPGEEARKAVDITLAIYESSQTGREVFL
jgi:UDP-N-acetyl-2-amino-2-deoxyglucuronate dehydrogenase